MSDNKFALPVEPVEHSNGRARTLDRIIGTLVSLISIVVGTGDDIISILTASGIKPCQVKWLWPNRIPLGKLTLFVGNPDNGKSLAGMYVAAMTTTGQPWFDAPNGLQPSEVLIFASEDDPEDTAVPRLMAAGADLHKVHFGKIPDDRGTKEDGEMRLDKDILAIGKALAERPAVKLIIIDPVSNYLGDTKMVEEQAVRRVLTPLQNLASEHGVSVLGIMHLNKK